MGHSTNFGGGSSGRGYDDYNAPDRLGRDRFGNTGFGADDRMVTRFRPNPAFDSGFGNLPVTTVESISNLFGQNEPYKALNFIERLMNPTISELMLSRGIDPGSNRVRDAYLSNNVLSAFNRPVRGNTTVYDPIQDRVFNVVDDNQEMDFLANLFNVIANPVAGSLTEIDTASLEDAMTGERGMNYRGMGGFLGDYELISDADLEEERRRSPDQGSGGSDDNLPVPPPALAGGLIPLNEDGDIPFYVLANLGLLTV